MALSKITVNVAVKPWWKLTKPIQYLLVIVGRPVWIPKWAVKTEVVKCR